MKKNCEKALRHARQKGFDEGFKLAKAVFAEIMANLIEEHRREIEELNTQIIMGDEDDGS